MWLWQKSVTAHGTSGGSSLYGALGDPPFSIKESGRLGGHRKILDIE